MTIEKEVTDELMKSIKDSKSEYYLTSLRDNLKERITMKEDMKDYYIHAINNRLMIVRLKSCDK